VYCTRTETISIAAVWQVGSHLNSKTCQGRTQNVRSENPIAVVVAEDGDPLLLPNRVQHAIDCVGHPRNRHRLGEVTPRAWLNELIYVLYFAADQDVE